MEAAASAADVLAEHALCCFYTGQILKSLDFQFEIICKSSGVGKED